MYFVFILSLMLDAEFICFNFRDMFYKYSNWMNIHQTLTFTSIQCTNNPLYLVTYEIYRQLSIILVVVLLNTIWFRNNYWWCHRPLVTDGRDAFVHNTPPRIALVCIFLDWPFKLLICNLTLLKCMRLSSIHQTN